MPIPSLQLQKKPVICREAEGSMFAKCDALPKGDVVHVCLRNPFPPFFLGIKSIHSLLVPEA